MSDQWKCSDDCGSCFLIEHGTHDIGVRHEDGELYSATCHDCDLTWPSR